MELEFADLEELRRFLAEISGGQVASLQRYYDPKIYGFKHKHDDLKVSPSIASTATCVLSLLASGRWLDSNAPWSVSAAELAAAILRAKWTSAKLSPDNPFSVAFVLETVTAFESAGIDLHLDDDLRSKVEKAETLLIQSLQNGTEPGAAQIEKYPPSAYVTQLVVRVLKSRNKLGDAKEKVKEWAVRQITRQITLLATGIKTGDVYALAYSTILLASLTDPGAMEPEEKRIQETAIEHVFKFQLPDGTWPLSRPLFHYPGTGNAHCFEYEMLVQLLQTQELEATLLKHMGVLKKAALALEGSAFPLDGGGRGWASGHHPQLKGPESWSTASVFHFVHVLNRLVSEAVRQSTFEYMDRPYQRPGDAKKDLAEFANGFLDCPLNLPGGETKSLRAELWRCFVEPIAKNADGVKHGRSLPEEVPMSAILFGPPGTSKTDLARHISEFLGWPLLTVDPSHLVRNGMDQIQAEANRLFTMLEASERMVVLLDEFDEMVRDRASAQSEAASRFLTTAMLPKLSRINKRRRIVFILATNYIDHFDFAISRPGRFDVILQVMPPTIEEKLRNWDDVAQKLRTLGLNLGDDELRRQQLEALTFGEFKRMAPKLAAATSLHEALTTIESEFSACTLERETTESKQQGQGCDEKWRDRCETQRTYIRL